jgi:MFS family permease
VQGPHIYAIYKYDKNLPEKVVAALYAAGFISGALAAFFAGQLADHYGRRRACLTYGVMYIITCLSMLSDNLIILFIGRLTGGVATTLLFSVFDAWMVSEYHTRGLAYMSLSLSSVFSYAAVMSPLIAIVMGVCGDAMVMTLGSRVWPFLAGAVCCVISMTWISMRWVCFILSHPPAVNSSGVFTEKDL